MEGQEITERGPLLAADGRLREPGWSRSPLLDYDRRAVRAPAWRIKEWDYYCALSESRGLALTVADNGYMGFLSATVLDLAERASLSDSVMTPFPLGGMGLPADSRAGVTEGRAPGIDLRFECAGGERRLKISWPSFGGGSAPRPPSVGCCGGLPPDVGPMPRDPGRVAGGVGLEGELILREAPGADSMVIATPFPGAPRAFYYNRKVNCLEVEGSFRLGRREFRFAPGEAMAVLDWGRGVWTWSNTWYWASVSGRLGGRSFGLNLGRGFGDDAAGTENMAFLDGRASKYGRVSFELPGRDLLAPWRFRSEDGRLDLVMEPLLDRASRTELLVLASDQHQVFGRWSGRIVLDDGEVLEPRGLVGFAERVRNRW